MQITSDKNRQYSFVLDNENSSVVFNFDEVHLSGMLERYERFLRACGFQFTGELEISETDE